MESRAGLLLLVVCLLGLAPAARAEVSLSQAEALALAFPGARVERHSLFLSADEARRIERRARVKVASRLMIVYLAWRGDRMAGAAFFDTRTVRTMPAVLMVVVAPDTTVDRVEVLAFHEPPDYRPIPRWLGLFRRRRLDDALWSGRGIRNLSGATLTARAVTESTRLALAVFQEIVATRLKSGAKRL